MSDALRHVARQYLPASVRSGMRRVLRRKAAGGPRQLPAGSAAPPPTDVRMLDRGVLDRLGTGEALLGIVVEQARASIDAEDHHAVTTAGESLRRRPETRILGSFVLGIDAFARGFDALAWKYLASVPRAWWSSLAMHEYLKSGQRADPDTVREQLVTLVKEPADGVSPDGWGMAASHAFAIGEVDLARSLFDRFDAAVESTGPEGLGPHTVETRDWMRPWMACTPDSASAPPASDGHVSFAIVDYGHPNRKRASANIGDHVQSIASLGHLVRHSGVSFHGPDDVVGLLEHLGAGVPDELRVDGRGVDVDVDVMTIDRDASAYNRIPPRTWTLAFGWFMHPIEETYGLPFHDNVLPLFVSFHCNKRDLLTPETVEHLRRFAPVGCRDWTTVDILLSLDVPAFFSGCLTTTVSTVFPPLTSRPSRSAPVAYIDMPEESVATGAAVFEHSNDAIRFRSFTRNAHDAFALLDDYRRNHSGVVTSRLHAYLPCRSLGMNVDFRPKNLSDVRFEGLGGISDDAFDAIRTGLLDRLEPVISAILEGADPDAVYDRWRSLTADAVELARRRHDAPAPVPSTSIDLRAGVSRVIAAAEHLERSAPTGDGRPIEVAVHVDQQNARRLDRGLGTLLTSLVHTTTRPVTVTVITRAPEQLNVPRWARQLPQTTWRILPTVGLGDELETPDGKTFAHRDLDLTLLPELMPEVERVVVLPTDAVVTSDIAELHDLDLGGHLVAAPTTLGSRGTSGFGLVHSAAGRLRERTARAAELRRITHARHTFDFDSLTTDVLVLDLAAMRERGFAVEQLGAMERFGLTMREALCAAVGPDRAVVPERWSAVPSRSTVDDAHLAYWPEAIKPWQDVCVPWQERWREVREDIPDPR